MGPRTDVHDHYVEMMLSVENGSSWAARGTPVLTELLALSYGLGFFFRSEWRTSLRLVLESDSLLAVEWIFHPDKCPPMFASLSRSIRRVIDENHVILRHIPRGCNVEADAQTKAEMMWFPERLEISSYSS
ncbi:hypothetical protein V6N11_011296 [Hibiscus sabdariffa]|uniref:RNase H type-1 domain-containing protein n=1 Tax=Hibiscus sabdariffa TaxID=183260 RepID=A0ABR2S7Z2_9ROSI